MDPALETSQLLTDGQILAGKYRILRLLGRGGMAEVDAAHHEILHQTVALKVLGISKAPRTADAADQSSTASQVILGTPSYMSPEQARSAKDADARADIWALGVILYRLLTGNLPFMADNIADMLAAILVQQQRPIRAFRPELSPELEAIVSRCLAKDRQARFATVAELAHALAPHASPAGRASVDRVSRTLGHPSEAKTLLEPNKPPLPSSPGNGAAAAVAVAVTAGEGATKLEGRKTRTDAAWMEASVSKAAASTGRRRLITGGAAGAVALIAVFVLWRSPHGEPGAPLAPVVPGAGSEIAAAGLTPLPVPLPTPSATSATAQPAPSVDATPPRSALASPPTPSAMPSAAVDHAPSAAPAAAIPPNAPRPPSHATAGAPLRAGAGVGHSAATAPSAPHPAPTPTASATYDVLDQRH